MELNRRICGIISTVEVLTEEGGVGAGRRGRGSVEEGWGQMEIPQMRHRPDNCSGMLREREAVIHKTILGKNLLQRGAPGKKM